MNTLFSKYIGLSMSYGFISSVLHIKNSKLETYIDNKHVIVPTLISDKIIWTSGYTLSAPAWIPFHLFENIRKSEIYFRSLNKEAYYDKNWIQYDYNKNIYR